ncbi:hypothetical protein FAM09_03935 [Niastella caeni]|uniref:Uncharacterized protein n=1 Tax=Niastella caeni TaxID=2569763 RepID=A0A4S8HZI8_9BACT|nr:hypothetical protein [Niastella caeni]THU41268.1 hypothetical protein FAM09_03935 [Niastella caeni]
MQETVLTTLIYKYNPYARFFVVLYIVSIFLFCLFTCDHIPTYIIWLMLCIWALPLVYGAISKKSIFNFRALDSRLLTLSSTYIKVGNQRYAIRDVAVELHITAYDGFIYSIRSEGLLKPQITYGDNNVLLFKFNGVSYDNEFHLRDYNSYITLCQLVDEWRAAGVPVIVKEAFTREFVDKQYVRKSRKKKK